MSVVTSFAPLAKESAKVLVLGSMPGVLSLKAQQYYAHPRNAFWRIMSSLYGFNADLPYNERVEKLTESGVAVWDVLQTCIRTGSLDSAIENGSQVANDFSWFLKQYPNIKRIGFNGATAEKSFRALCLPHLKTIIAQNAISFVRLPSSSPAYTQTLDVKIATWRSLLGNHMQPDMKTYQVSSML